MKSGPQASGLGAARNNADRRLGGLWPEFEASGVGGRATGRPVVGGGRQKSAVSLASVSEASSTRSGQSAVVMSQNRHSCALGTRWGGVSAASRRRMLVSNSVPWLTSRVPGRRASCRGWARRAPGTSSGRGSSRHSRCRSGARRLI